MANQKALPGPAGNQTRIRFRWALAALIAIAFAGAGVGGTLLLVGIGGNDSAPPRNQRSTGISTRLDRAEVQ